MRTGDSLQESMIVAFGKQKAGETAGFNASPDTTIHHTPITVD